jgi:hypothetical protein
VWLRRLLLEIVPEWNKPLPLMCDDISAIELSRSPIFEEPSTSKFASISSESNKNQRRSMSNMFQRMRSWQILSQSLWPSLVFFFNAKRLV